MKICAACSQSLPKENFSKKQWQLKQQRRCKECVAANQEVTSAEASTEPRPPLRADGEGTAASCWTDEDLFKQPPPRDECPICMLTLPLIGVESKYQACCGKMLCVGCIYAVDEADNRCLCPFCRTPLSASHGEAMERLKKRVEVNDAQAIYQLGGYYLHGRYGLRQNTAKAKNFSFGQESLGTDGGITVLDMLITLGKELRGMRR